MLDEPTRTAILRLAREGHAVRWIARAVGVNRDTVQRVLASGSAVPPPIERPERLLAHLDPIRELHLVCEGNLVRVREMLAERGVQVAYATLTGFCRRHQIGVEPKERAGQYAFAPGEEMQHDTSPHDVRVGGILRRMQCASLVLCFSRWKYVQLYRRWTRFHAKAFLTEAIEFFGGAAARGVVDNSSVLLAHGNGPNAVFAPDAVALGDRFGFTFMACNLNDPDRKGRVERPFQDVEGNFYPGRTFEDDADLNRQARQWCVDQSRLHRRRLKASWHELHAIERPSLKPLPPFVPEVYEVYQRGVDLQGFVQLHTNRYSVPDELLGRDVIVHETLQRVRILYRHRIAVDHERAPEGAGEVVWHPEHTREGRFKRARRAAPLPEEGALRAAGLGDLVDVLRREHGGRAVQPVRALYRLFRDYPDDAVKSAVATALEHGLHDVRRIERIVLQRIRSEFFRLPTDPENEDG
jgi:transposase